MHQRRLSHIVGRGRIGTARQHVAGHHIGLNTWESRGGSPPPPGTTGLYHTAILYPTRRALANALRRVIDAGITLDGASDHGVSEALYLRDPDDNGVELYWDRPKEAWPRTPQGELAMFSRRLDLNGLLKEVQTADDAPEVRKGHGTYKLPPAASRQLTRQLGQ